MNYRSLLVLLDHEGACAARSKLAMRLARERDCHLVGLAPTGLIDLPAATQAAAPLAEYATLAWDALRDQAEDAAQRFRDECQRAGLKSYEAVIDEADKAPSLVRHAHCSDLVVLTQARRDPQDKATQVLVEEVVLYSARPTLVLPHTGRFDGAGSKVLVAWDDSREAARALNDALPILLQAQQVQLVYWKKTDVPEDETLRPRLDAVSRWLMWHGVASEVSIESSDRRLADAMLSRASGMGADLIVMGAYGHARWAERVLGGATRDMLATSTLPLLMSH